MNLNLKRWQVTVEVNRKLRHNELKIMQDYAKHHFRQHLWGDHKVEDVVLLAMYKDLYGFGYRAIEERINFGYKITHHSLEHNIPLIRECLRGWAETVIVPGNSTEWKAARSGLKLGSKVNDGNLWMDSTDFPVSGKVSTSRKSPRWSFKLNGPGRRYMMVFDAKGCAKFIWGGYSPKRHDSDTLGIIRQQMESDFRGGVVIADNHFRSGSKHFVSVKFHTNYALKESGKKRKRNEDPFEDTVDNITRDQARYNEQHQAARARVESPFGSVKKKWVSLDQPWNESDEQLDCAVFVAVACLVVTLSFA